MKKPLPPIYFLASLVLIAACHFLLPVSYMIHGAWRSIGLLPLALGIFLNISADRAFKKHCTTVKPFEESTALVAEGVFNFSRNPMYLGMVLILAGVALLAGSATSWIPVVIFAVLIDQLFIAPEELMLEEKFGEQFSQYKHGVRRWL
jgi:protein-S-isoprenylcysteine O-methyltransferase Ste14